MAEISATTVMELRRRTGLGMMDCKKALTEAAGDLAKAEEILRIRSGAKASKAAGRVAAEGVIAVSVAADAKSAAIVEVNCETDFVARNDDFKAYAAELAELVRSKGTEDPAALADLALASGVTVEARRVALVQKIGENIEIRRCRRLEGRGAIASYVHGTRIGVLVDVSGGAPSLGRDLAMHIAASRPIAVAKDDVPAEVIARERSIAAARAAESGKPPNIIEKMVDGAVAKFLAEVTLLGQPFVKNDKETVGALAKSQGATVNGFVLYVVGEGIEKRRDDFAAEVAALSRG